MTKVNNFKLQIYVIAKVTLSLKPVGQTSALAIKNIAVVRSKNLSEVSSLIKTKLGCKPTDTVFIYVRSAFAPSPDSRVGDLFDVS